MSENQQTVKVILNGQVIVDLTGITAGPEHVQAGKTFVTSTGVLETGTATMGGGEGDIGGILDGTVTTLEVPTGRDELAPYRFYRFEALAQADITGVHKVGERAFYECKALSELTGLEDLTEVGEYAFYQAGSETQGAFVLAPTAALAVGAYAFQYVRVTEITGTFSEIGSYAFASCGALARVDIEATGGVGTYAFYNCTGISELAAKITGDVGAYAFCGMTGVRTVSIDPESDITSLGSYAFSRFGGSRASPADNPIVLDLRGSSFGTVPAYAFGGDSSTATLKNRYMTVFLPASVKTVEGYAFRYSDNCKFYFASEKPPALSATTAWSNATNCKNFVPWASLSAYREATNWAAQTANLFGFAPAGSFADGATLPALNAGGYACTWYTDEDMTVAATTAAADEARYCVAGTEKLGYGIKSRTAVNCALQITSADGKTYAEGEGIPTGTVVTIAATPTTEGYVPYFFTVGGAAFTSGQTVTVEGDLDIVAIYYDGVNVPINPNFAENTWIMIGEAFKSGIASTFFKAGDTKTLELSDGNTYTVRLSDTTDGRYELADGTGTSHAVLEFVELLPTSYAINASAVSDGSSSAYTAGGWSLCAMNKTVLAQTVWGLLPEDFKGIVKEIKLNEYSYTAPSPRESTCKVFLPAETEVFKTIHYSAEGSQTGCVKYDQWTYYAAITDVDGSTSVARQKHKVNTTASAWWWLRSPHSGYAGYFCSVYASGAYDGNYANYTGGVAPCFAI